MVLIFYLTINFLYFQHSNKMHEIQLREIFYFFFYVIKKIIIHRIYSSIWINEKFSVLEFAGNALDENIYCRTKFFYGNNFAPARI